MPFTSSGVDLMVGGADAALRADAVDVIDPVDLQHVDIR
jgi:hypothetical protein